MDPTANLEMQLRMAQELLTDNEMDNGIEVNYSKALELAELVIALSGWIENGG